MTLLDLTMTYGISAYTEKISPEVVRIHFRHPTVPLQFQQTIPIDSLIHGENVEDKICAAIYQEMLPYIKGFDPEYTF